MRIRTLALACLSLSPIAATSAHSTALHPLSAEFYGLAVLSERTALSLLGLCLVAFAIFGLKVTDLIFDGIIHSRTTDLE